MTNPDWLLPCPFCGGAALLHSISFATLIVFCSKCNAQTGEELGDFEAIAAWNRRASASVTQDRPSVELVEGNGHRFWMTQGFTHLTMPLGTYIFAGRQEKSP